MRKVAYATAGYALDEHGREVECAVRIEILRARDGARWTRAELAGRLSQFDAQAMRDAIGRLAARGVIRVKKDTIQAPGSATQREKLDLLSAVVVHVLVVAHPKALPVAAVAHECERNLAKPEEVEEIELALRWIEGDGLAVRQGDGWIATRPAVRADELSF